MSNAVETAVESYTTMGNVVEGKKKEIVDGDVSASTPGVFISPWTADSNQTTHLTVFQHGLGKTPQSLLVMFSPDGDSVFPLQWPWATASGNPVTISMTATNVTLNIWSGGPLHATWSAVTGTWTQYTSGYWMVIAKASA